MEDITGQLEELLSVPTPNRTELGQVTETVEELERPLDFDVDFEKVEELEAIDSEEEEEEPRNYKEDAQNLVALISSVNQLVVPPIAKGVLQKRRGGKKTIKSLQALFEKDAQGKDLTEKEQSRLNTYLSYLRDKDEITKAIPYTEEEEKLLVSMAEPFVKASGFKVGGGAAFFGALAAIQGQRIISIIQA